MTGAVITGIRRRRLRRHRHRHGTDPGVVFRRGKTTRWRDGYRQPQSTGLQRNEDDVGRGYVMRRCNPKVKVARYQ